MGYPACRILNLVATGYNIGGHNEYLSGFYNDRPIHHQYDSYELAYKCDYVTWQGALPWNTFFARLSESPALSHLVEPFKNLPVRNPLASSAITVKPGSTEAWRALDRIFAHSHTREEFVRTSRFNPITIRPNDILRNGQRIHDDEIANRLATAYDHRLADDFVQFVEETRATFSDPCGVHRNPPPYFDPILDLLFFKE